MALEDYLLVLIIFTAGGKNDEAGIRNNKKYFLLGGEIKYYNVLMEGVYIINQLMI